MGVGYNGPLGTMGHFDYLTRFRIKYFLYQTMCDNVVRYTLGHASHVHTLNYSLFHL